MGTWKYLISHVDVHKTIQHKIKLRESNTTITIDLLQVPSPDDNVCTICGFGTEIVGKNEMSPLLNTGEMYNVILIPRY